MNHNIPYVGCLAVKNLGNLSRLIGNSHNPSIGDDFLEDDEILTAVRIPTNANDIKLLFDTQMKHRPMLILTLHTNGGVTGLFGPSRAGLH